MDIVEQGEFYSFVYDFVCDLGQYQIFFDRDAVILLSNMVPNLVGTEFIF